MERRFLLAILPVLALTARADCGPTQLSAVLNDLHYPLKYDQNQRLIDGIIRCQPTSADPGKSVLALSLRHPTQDQHNDHFDIYSLDVVVFRSSDGVVLARYTKPDEFLSDAVELKDIKLDMGQYTLNADTRAFGVRANYSIAGLAVYNYQALTLFVQKDSAITEVVSGLVTGEAHYDGGYGPRCTAFSGETDHLYAGQLIEVRRSVEPALQKTNGYADLTITETGKTVSTKNLDGTCVKTTEPPTQSRSVLKYDGDSYVLPKELRAE